MLGKSVKQMKLVNKRPPIGEFDYETGDEARTSSYQSDDENPGFTSGRTSFAYGTHT